VWKPKAPAGWAPFRNGRWLWYDGLGYTWIGDDAWGWLPYHYGRWMLMEGTGWIWAPGDSTVFKPGDVYWLKSAKLVGWGALAPGEDWKPPEPPRLYLNANTTYAVYTPAALEIDPASFASRPKEPLAAAVFAEALPSPPFPAARLDALRPPLRAGSSRAVSVSTETAYEAPPSPAPSDTAYTNGPPAEPPVVIVNTPPQEVEVEVDVPVPVYTGIILVTPPGYRAPPSKNPPKPVSPPAPHEPTPKPKVPDPDKPVK
jgi:hypothetical protein